MLWLDGVWPRDEDASDPGNTRGDCPADSGVPSEVIAEHGDAYVDPSPFSLFSKRSQRLTKFACSYVTWSNIRFGPIGSTTGL
jgi:cellulose 1,4-beta-cellobiosidase